MKNKLILFIFFLLSITILQAQSEDNYLDFYTAAYDGDYQTTYTLIQEGIKIDSADYDGITALMYASSNGNIKIVELLLENNADVNIKPFDGRTALIAAVRAGEFDIAELLIRAQANINESDYYTFTSLLYAITNNDFFITDMLLYYEAKPDICDENGYSPIAIASLFGSDSLVNSLLLAGANFNVYRTY